MRRMYRGSPAGGLPRGSIHKPILRDYRRSFDDSNDGHSGKFTSSETGFTCALEDSPGISVAAGSDITSDACRNRGDPRAGSVRTRSPAGERRRCKDEPP